MIEFFSQPDVLSVIVMILVYIFLIYEKPDKVIVVGLGAVVLIALQVFGGGADGLSSGMQALTFIEENMEMLIFVIGMMMIMGIVSTSGIFDAMAIAVVKFVRGNPFRLLVGVMYLGYAMSVILPNIPAILVLTPVVLIVVRQLKLPFLPYMFVLINATNIAGAATPISDPTTNYLANQLGLTFGEVLANSGAITFLLTIVTLIYTYFIFRKELSAAHSDNSDVQKFEPLKAIKDHRLARGGVAITIGAVIWMASAQRLHTLGFPLFENATIAMLAVFLLMIIFRTNIHAVLHDYIDRKIIFFFSGLFIVVGSLKFTGVTESLARSMLDITGGNDSVLLFMFTVGSSILSVFIDNVPYNITMVGILQDMQATGFDISQLIRGLNLGTSLGGAGSLIGSACNVCAFGLAEKEGFSVSFRKYLVYGLPLVIINATIAFFLLR